MGTPPIKTNKTPSIRGTLNGWTSATTRRNTNFLRSVDDLAIQCTSDGEPLTGLACTFTVKHCPESHTEWERIRKAFFDRLRRLDLHRSHWLTEWQRRGVPHMHACLFFPEVEGIPYVRLIEAIESAWIDLTAHLEAKPNSQHIMPIYDAVGWFQYQSKHASRGMFHYQRSQENIPEQWKKTGRMWGKTGDWPIIEPEKILVNDKVFFAFRRLVRSWRIADAKQSQNLKRISSAKKMLKHNDKDKSKLRGVSEWISKEQSRFLLQTVLDIHGSQSET